MELNDAARNLIGKGADATLVTLNPDGSPQVSVVWVALQSTPDGDELVTAHLAEHKKVRNVRKDPRVAVTILSLDPPGQGMRPYLSVSGTARIVEGGAVTDRIDMGERVAIACALGGPERRTLFLLSSTDAYPQRLIGTRLSRLDAVTVTTPGAGLPSGGDAPPSPWPRRGSRYDLARLYRLRRRIFPDRRAHRSSPSSPYSLLSASSASMSSALRAGR